MNQVPLDMKTNRLFIARRSSRRRGVTLVEAMISMLITGLMGVAIVGVMRETGRTQKVMFAETRTRATRMAALQALRFRLVEAKIGTVEVSHEGHRIEFQDPNIEGATSTFFFNPDTRKLFYDDRIHDLKPASLVLSGPIDLTFGTLESGELGLPASRIRLRVRSSAETAIGDVDTQEGVTEVYMRN